MRPTQEPVGGVPCPNAANVPAWTHRLSPKSWPLLEKVPQPLTLSFAPAGAGPKLTPLTVTTGGLLPFGANATDCTLRGVGVGSVGLGAVRGLGDGGTTTVRGDCGA